MLTIVAASGLVGSVTFAIFGALAPSSSELFQILSLACLFAAAGGFLGYWIDDGQRSRGRLGVGATFQLLVAAPLVLFMTFVFLVTFLPALYFIVPALLMWPLKTPPENARYHRPFHAHIPAYQH